MAEAQPTVKLQFPFPDGSANESPSLISLKDGQKVPPTQIDAAVEYTLKRGLVLQAAAMVGAGDDVAKAQGQFQSGAAEIPQLVFLQALGKSLFEISALFGKEQLHDPKIQKVMLDSALQCLGPALEAEDAQLKQRAEEIKKEIEKQEKSRRKRGGGLAAVAGDRKLRWCPWRGGASRRAGGPPRRAKGHAGGNAGAAAWRPTPRPGNDFIQLWHNGNCYISRGSLAVSGCGIAPAVPARVCRSRSPYVQYDGRNGEFSRRRH